MPQLRLDRESVRKQYEMSLKRLGIDFIDMYMIHWPFAAEYLEEGWATLAELEKKAKSAASVFPIFPSNKWKCSNPFIRWPS